MSRKQNAREYFQFSRKDRIAALVAGLILITAFFLPPALEKRISTRQLPQDTTWISDLRRLEESPGQTTSSEDDAGRRANRQAYSRSNSYNNTRTGLLFPFDPNTLSPENWKKLGIRDRTIQTIQNYLAKGGRFRKAEDLSRIYGLENDYPRLAPFISIAVPGNRSPARKPPAEARIKTGTDRAAARTLEINTADSATWEALPGIGPVLSARICRFREKLGGFHAIDQVAEVYGLTDSVFETIRPYLLLEDNRPPQLININTADLETLKAHPYISYKLAGLILNYRNQHGLFKSVDEIRKIKVIGTEDYLKIRPYLTLTLE